MIEAKLLVSAVFIFELDISFNLFRRMDYLMVYINYVKSFYCKASLIVKSREI